MCVPCSANKCRIQESDLRADCAQILIRPSETWFSDGLMFFMFKEALSNTKPKKIIYKQAARRSGSRIRHLFVEQGTRIALAVGQTSDSRIRPTQMMLPNCFLFCKVIFLNRY